MESQQLILTTKDELRRLLREELQSISNEHSKEPANDDQILKRTDIAKMFGVSLVTVHSWMKVGHLPFHRIGGKTYFKKGEVIDALRQVKIRRKS